ncbi:MAG: preprotein translocase subunit YajC [Bdellovibrionales bacterium RIFCSPHIGHO2_01_FULL_40_29]|nr:MAG: preprotein translocase subunit YajC [Bdellovibrionales bacterium RIFCSPHIGHO2_01_FULL_40_29]OFZ34430.1 MAG: preprotein translocase subunit YajC [Bdellovibrionales bacterium RIFCSPHIGHO2_02_FULL_40_15]
MDLIVNLFLFGQTVLAQTTEVATATAAQPAPPAYMQFVPFVIIIGVFYFFLIRPQAKKQKETQTFLSGLKVGDQVITQSGILGRIAALTDKLVTLEVANNVQIKVMRSQVLTSQAVLQDKKEGK